MPDARATSPRSSRRSPAELVGTYLLSYLLCVLLLAALVWTAGVWNILANTRLLDLLISSGIVRYHDVNQGFVAGLPDQKLFLLSQDPVDWRLAAVVVALYFLFWGVRALKFHGIARHLGMTGGLAEHAKAFFYGTGLNILYPFRLGNIGTALACEAQGESRARANTANYTQDLFVLFEIAVFASLGLVLNGWATWLGQIFWALVILGAAYLLLRPAQEGGVFLPGQATWSQTREIVRGLLEQPLILTKLALLSLLAFLIDDFTPYLISQAFTTDWVILNVPFSVIQMGVVAGYISRQVAVTPGGIGQWEWGFAMALYMGGVGMPEAATIALLESAVRHGTGLAVFGIVVVWKGVDTSVRTAFPVALEPAASGAGGET